MVDKMNFFKDNAGNKSMMRLCTFILVSCGCIITGGAVWFELSGGHYGLELAILGIIGKSYQKGKE